MRRFYALNLPKVGEVIALSSEQSHHLLRVVGIAPNEVFELFTGKGQACLSRLDRVEDGLAFVVWLEDVVSSEHKTTLWVLLSLTKQHAFSLTLRMMTEIGANMIVPILAERSIPRKDKNERWHRIVRSASQQCGRQDVPSVTAVQTLDEALKLCTAFPNRFLLHPKSPSLSPVEASDVAILVGPEGGFSDIELQTIDRAGWKSRGIGPFILRADTAAAVAAGILRSTN